MSPSGKDKNSSGKKTAKLVKLNAKVRAEKHETVQQFAERFKDYASRMVTRELSYRKSLVADEKTSQSSLEAFCQKGSIKIKNSKKDVYEEDPPPANLESFPLKKTRDKNSGSNTEE